MNEVKRGVSKVCDICRLKEPILEHICVLSQFETFRVANGSQKGVLHGHKK